MDSENNNLGFNTVVYALSITGFKSAWPSNNQVEDPHVLILKGFSADGVNSAEGEIGDTILGADGSIKVLDKNGLIDFSFTLFPNTNALEDLVHYYNRTQVGLGEKRIGQKSVQLQIIKTTLKTMDCYNGTLVNFGGIGGANRDDGQQSISFTFRTPMKTALTKTLTDEELMAYGADNY